MGRWPTRVIPGPSGGFRKIGLFGKSIFGLCPISGGVEKCYIIPQHVALVARP